MKLSTLLPYTCIASDCILSLKKNRITAILEMHVSTVEDSENMQVMHDRVMKLITDFPEESVVSIYYTKTFIKQTIPFVNNHKNSIINYLEKKRNETLLGKNPTTYKCFMSVSIPLTEGKSNKGGVDIINKLVNNKQDFNNLDQQRDIVKRAAKRLDLIVTGFSNAIDNRAFRLKSEQIAQFLSLILNHSFLDQFTEFSDVFKSDFISSYNKIIDANKHGYVYYGGNYHAVLSLRAYGEESSLPTNSSPEINQMFLKEILKEVPYTIHHVVQIPPREKSIKIAKGRKNRIEVQSAFASNISFLAKTPEGIPPKELKEMISDSINIIESTGQRFLFQQYQIHLWSDSLKDLQEKIEFLKSNTKEMTLKVEKYNIKGAFFSLFPGYEDTNPIKMMIPSYNVADFLPIDMPRFCYPTRKSKDFIYYFTKEDQLTKLDLFDDRADNWNAIICGGSGSGKSFICNDILSQYSVYNAQIAIVDYGGVDAGSYRNFINNNKGTYLEIDLDTKNFSINPFDGKLFDEKGEIIAWKIESLKETIVRMGSDDDDPIDSNSRFTIDEELRTYYLSKKNNSDNSCNITEFAELHLKDNNKFSPNQDVYKRIYQFIGTGIKEGSYARFFQKTNEIKSKDFICFDMAGLAGHQKLKKVLIPALLEMISTNILGSSEYERKKLLVIDEAWNDLKGGAMKDFMELMFRTVRKLNGSISIITQNFLDVLNSTIGEALLVNTSYYWFVGNKHQREPLLKASASSGSGNMRLTEYDVSTILNSKSKRDFYLLTPFFSGLLKFYPSKEFCLLATTNAEEKNMIRKHREKLGVEYVTPEVIESVLGNK
jgi:hypothetical protein